MSKKKDSKAFIQLMEKQKEKGSGMDNQKDNGQ